MTVLAVEPALYLKRSRAETDFDSFAFRTPKDAIEFHFNREADKLWGEEDLSNWRRMIYEGMQAEQNDPQTARLFRANTSNASYKHSQFYQTRASMPAKREFVSPQMYAKLEAEANGRCQHCNNPFDGTPHIDHDHATGKVRGLLCTYCNVTDRGTKRKQVQPIRHGTRYAYARRGCRCTDCRANMARLSRATYQRRKGVDIHHREMVQCSYVEIHT